MRSKSRSHSLSKSREREDSRRRSRSNRRRSYSRSRSRSRNRRSRSRDRYRRRDRTRSRSRSRDRRRRSPALRPWSPPAGVTRDAPEPSKVLGVFGLNSKTRENDLEDKFGKYGKTEKVIIIYNQRSNESRCYGFVYYENLEDATTARSELNGTILDGRKIRVDYSITQKAHNPTPGRYMGNVKRDRRDYRSSHRRYRRSRSISRSRRSISRSRSRSRSSRHRRRSRSGSIRRRR